MHELRAMTERALDKFFAESGIDWRRALDGQRLELDLSLDGEQGRVEKLVYANGVRQQQPPAKTSLAQCAAALAQVGNWLRELPDKEF